VTDYTQQEKVRLCAYGQGLQRTRVKQLNMCPIIDYLHLFPAI